MSRPDRPEGRTVPGNRWDLTAGLAALPVSVSVVVTHFEQPAELRRTLHALDRQTHPRELVEVLVVDDGSATAPEVPAGVRLLRQADEGFRAAAARNLGARHAGGQVLVFLDADTTPEPDYLARISRLPGLLPETVVVGRRRHADLAGTPYDAPVELAGPAHELAEPAWLSDGLARSRGLLEVDELSFRFVISAVAACTRWWHDEIGGFDESFEGYGGEDWEWAHRSFVHGGLLAHEPAAVAWHDGAERGSRDAGGGAAARASLREETLAVARRIGEAGVRPTGLLLGAPELAVTVAPEVGAEQLVIALDSVLAALPHARVLLRPDQAGPVTRDPRVSTLAEPVLDGFARHLHLRAGVRAPVSAWRGIQDELLGIDPPGCVDVGDPAGQVLVTASALRAVRRHARWGRDDLFRSESRIQPALELLGDTPTLQAHFGGWA